MTGNINGEKHHLCGGRGLNNERICGKQSRKVNLEVRYGAAEQVTLQMLEYDDAKGERLDKGENVASFSALKCVGGHVFSLSFTETATRMS